MHTGERFLYNNELHQFMHTVSYHNYDNNYDISQDHSVAPTTYVRATRLRDAMVVDIHTIDFCTNSEKLTIPHHFIKHIDSAHMANIIMQWIEEHGDKSLTVSEVNRYLPTNVQLVCQH